MSHEKHISEITGPDYLAIFEALSTSSLLINADKPRYTILAATPLHLKHGGVTKQNLIGKGLFEVYPDNPDNVERTGETNLRTSLDYVVKHKRAHQLPIQRYDVADESGNFVERYWRAEHRPVFGPGGVVTSIIQTVDDLTEKILSEVKDQRLKGMELVNSLFMQAPIPICLLKGEDLIVELANEPTLHLWGKSKTVMGLRLQDAVPEVTGQGYLEMINEVRKTGITKYLYESPVTLIRNEQKETIYINYVYQPYYESNNEEPVGVLAIGNDVTSKVVTSNLARETEARFRTLFENMDQGFSIIEMIFDENGRPVDSLFLDMNAVFEKQSGFEGAVGRRIRDIVPDIEDKWFEVYGKVAKTREPIRFTDGSDALQKWFDIYAFPAGASESRQVAVLFTDVTEQMQSVKRIEESESRFRKLADDSPIFIFIIEAGPLAPVSYWNRTWLEYTGQTAEEAVGRAWNGIIHADDLIEVMNAYSSAFISRSPYIVPAVRVKRFDGIYRWHSFKGNPRFLPNGELGGYIGVGFDIHDQKISEEVLEQLVAKRTEELIQINKELERSNRNLEDFAYAASHDLKEPIRKIRVFTQQVREQLKSHLQETELKAFNRIENATERMSALIDDLLLYSHVTHQPQEKEDIDLNLKVQRVLEDLEIEIETRKAVVTFDALPVVKGHRRQLQQLFQNIIGNSLKYSKEHIVPQITIQADLVTKDNERYHVIIVKDNGIGFEQQYAEKIFQMFTRLHSYSEYGGTGIGLSIVKKVIDNHNGSITAESAVDVGTTFKIYLPV